MALITGLLYLYYNRRRSRYRVNDKWCQISNGKYFWGMGAGSHGQGGTDCRVMAEMGPRSQK